MRIGRRNIAASKSMQQSRTLPYDDQSQDGTASRLRKTTYRTMPARIAQTSIHQFTGRICHTSQQIHMRRKFAAPHMNRLMMLALIEASRWSEQACYRNANRPTTPKVSPFSKAGWVVDHWGICSSATATLLTYIWLSSVARK